MKTSFLMFSWGKEEPDNEFRRKAPLFSLPTDVINLCGKIEFENPTIMEGKQCKQTKRFSVMTKARDYFLSLYDKSK